MGLYVRHKQLLKCTIVALMAPRASKVVGKFTAGGGGVIPMAPVNAKMFRVVVPAGVMKVSTMGWTCGGDVVQVIPNVLQERHACAFGFHRRATGVRRWRPSKVNGMQKVS